MLVLLCFIAHTSVLKWRGQVREGGREGFSTESNGEWAGGQRGTVGMRDHLA